MLFGNQEALLEQCFFLSSWEQKNDNNNCMIVRLIWILFEFRLSSKNEIQILYKRKKKQFFGSKPNELNTRKNRGQDQQFDDKFIAQLPHFKWLTLIVFWTVFYSPLSRLFMFDFNLHNAHDDIKRKKKCSNATTTACTSPNGDICCSKKHNLLTNGNFIGNIFSLSGGVCASCVTENKNVC